MVRSSNPESLLEPLATLLGSSKQSVYSGLRHVPGAFRWVSSVMQLFNRNRTHVEAQAPIREIIAQLEEQGLATAQQNFHSYAAAFEAAVPMSSFLHSNSPGGTAAFASADHDPQTGIPCTITEDSPVAWCMPVKERHASKSTSHRQGAVCARVLSKLLEEHNKLVLLAYQLQTESSRDDALTALRFTQVQSALLSDGDAFTITREEMLDFARKECCIYKSDSGGSVEVELDKLNSFLLCCLSHKPMVRVDTTMLEGEEKTELDTWCWFKGETAELLREAFLKPIPEAIRQQIEEELKKRPGCKAEVLDCIELCVKFLTAGQQLGSNELCNANLVEYMRDTYDLEVPSGAPAALSSLKMQHIGRLVALLSTGSDDDVVDDISEQFQASIVSEAEKAEWMEMLHGITAQNSLNLSLLRLAMIEVAKDFLLAGSGVDPESSIYDTIAHIPLDCLEDKTLGDLDWFTQEFKQHFCCKQYAALLRCMADA